MPILCKKLALPLLLSVLAAGLAGCAARETPTAGVRDPSAQRASTRHAQAYKKRVQTAHRKARRTHGQDVRTADAAKAENRVANAATAATAGAQAGHTLLSAKLPAQAAAPAAPPAAAAPKAADGKVAAIAPSAAGGQANASAAAQVGSVATARQLFFAGQVVRAREILQTLLPGANGEAVLELARTFDPHYLGLTSGRDATANVTRARDLYQEATSKGAGAAAGDLKRLLDSFPILSRS